MIIGEVDSSIVGNIGIWLFIDSDIYLAKYESERVSHNYFNLILLIYKRDKKIKIKICQHIQPIFLPRYIRVKNLLSFSRLNIIVILSLICCKRDRLSMI